MPPRAVCLFLWKTLQFATFFSGGLEGSTEKSLVISRDFFLHIRPVEVRKIINSKWIDIRGYPIQSMGMVYLPTFTTKINHSCRWNILISTMDPLDMWSFTGGNNLTWLTEKVGNRTAISCQESLEVDSWSDSLVNIFILTVEPKMTLVLIGTGFVLRGWPSKTEVIWAPGMCIVYIQLVDVGGWTNPSEKYQSKWDFYPNRGDKNNYLKPPPSIYITSSISLSTIPMGLACFIKLISWDILYEQSICANYIKFTHYD